MSDKDFADAVDHIVNGRNKIVMKITLGCFAAMTVIFVAYALTHPECL